MKRNELIKEITEIMDEAVFMYKGELYNKDYESIGYLPDITNWVCNYLDFDDEDWYELTNYIQVDIFDMFCKIYPYDENTFWSRYIKHIKNLLINLI